MRAGREYYGSVTARMVRSARCNPRGYLLLRCSMHARHIKQREEHEMFIFHDVVDLFALFGVVHFGRFVLKRRHKVS
jgi:hypothetical protein